MVAIPARSQFLTVANNPNIIENISGSGVCDVSSFDKLKMQSSFVLDGDATITVGLQNGIGCPGVVKSGNVGIVQVGSCRSKGDVKGATMITSTTIEAIATVM